MDTKATVESFFDKKPECKQLYEALAEKIMKNHPDTRIKVQKSQIAFYDMKPFCWVWMPIRDGIKGRPDQYIILSFGLNREIQHPRLVGTTEPYTGRWTHHVIIGSTVEMDAQLMNWIDEAYHWRNNHIIKGGDLHEGSGH